MTDPTASSHRIPPAGYATGAVDVDGASGLRDALAGLAVVGVLAAVRAELLQVHPIRVVAAVLLGDVVAVLAHLTRQGDLRSYVGGCHCECLSCDRACIGSV